MQCQATNKKTGEQCKRRAVNGKRVCQVHGGVTPAGIASPHFKTGRYSRSLPARLSQRYEESEADPRLLELRSEVSLIDARLADVLSRVDTGESGALWASLMDARGELIQAKRSGDTVSQAKLINLILELIGKGHTDYRAWAEVGSLLEARRKLVESERKRQIEMQQTITAEKAMLLIGAILGVIRDNVTDRQQLNAISTAIVGLAALEAGE